MAAYARVATVCLVSTLESLSMQSPAHRNVLVDLRRVSKFYGKGRPVLDNVSLQVQAGEFVFITGSSGAGKSTLLRLLYGADSATKGDVLVLGASLTNLNLRSRAMLRRQVGVVFQDFKLLPNRTVAENVSFVLEAQGFPPSEIRRRLAPTLKMVDLLEKQDRFPHELSGGEQQRVSLARAIVNRPPLLLADEPTGNLDHHNSLLLLGTLQRLNSFGVTILMTTHDQTLLSQCDYRCLHLDQGKVKTVRESALPYSVV